MTEALTEPQERKHSLVIAVLVALATLAGATIRVHVASTEAMWRDEAQTVAIASRPFPSGITKALKGDGNSPLFYLAEHFVVAARDNPFRELQDRSISVLLGIALIPLSFFATRAIGGSAQAGVVSCVLITFAPISIENATQARPYAALAVSASLMLLGVARWRTSAVSCCVYVIASVAAFYLHTLAAPMLLGMSAFCLIDALRHSAVRRLFALHATIGALIAPGILVALRNASALTDGGRIPWSPEPTLRDLWYYLVALVAGAPSGTTQVVVATLITLMVVTAALRSSTREVVIGVLVALVAGVCLAFSTGALVIRYNAAIAVMLIVACTTALDGIRNRALAFITATLVAAGYIAFAVLDSGYYQGFGSRSASRAAAMIVASQARADDVVLVLPDSVGVSINYYLPSRWKQMDPPLAGRAELLDFRQWKRQLVAAENSRSAEMFLDEAFRAHKRTWLIIHSPLRHPLPAAEARQAMPAQQWMYAQKVVSAFTERYYVVGRPLNFSSFREGVVVLLGDPANNVD